MYYFIADLHLGHTNVLKFDNRPFDNIQEHDEYMIRKWNEVVKPEDDVFILGDISWHNIDKTVEIYERLNGKLHLIIGNHDAKIIRNNKIKSLFVEICDYKELKIDDKICVLFHYPILCFNKHYYGSYHFYGHVHNSYEWVATEQYKDDLISKSDKPCNMINIGCMMPYMDYQPRTFNEIVKGYNECVENNTLFADGRG